MNFLAKIYKNEFFSKLLKLSFFYQNLKWRGPLKIEFSYHNLKWRTPNDRSMKSAYISHTTLPKIILSSQYIKVKDFYWNHRIQMVSAGVLIIYKTQSIYFLQFCKWLSCNILHVTKCALLKIIFSGFSHYTIYTLHTN